MCKPMRLVAHLHDMAMMGQTIHQRRGHLGIDKHTGPLGEVRVGGDRHTGVLVQ